MAEIDASRHLYIVTPTPPPSPTAAPGGPDPETAAEIEAAALAWAARVDRAPLSADDRAELEAWAAADPRRAGAYARARAASAYLDRAAALGTGFRSAGHERAPVIDRRRALAAGGGLLAASLAGAVGLGVLRHRERIVTPRGDVRRVSLPEGSSVTLNTSTALRPDIEGAVRRVELIRGEALFDVAKDPARPFVVAARDLRVRVVGTSFTVRVHEDDRVEVAVREGVVEVHREGDAQPLRLTAGDVAVAAPAGELRRSSAPLETLERAMAWREGRLDLTGLTLGQAAAEFRRYSGRPIVVDDPAVAALKVAGVYSISDPEGFARAAAIGLGLEAVVEPERIRLRRSAIS